MNFIKNSVIAKVVSVSIISISISMAILTFLVVNNSFEMMKTNTEKISTILSGLSIEITPDVDDELPKRKKSLKR